MRLDFLMTTYLEKIPERYPPVMPNRGGGSNMASTLKESSQIWGATLLNLLKEQLLMGRVCTELACKKPGFMVFTTCCKTTF